MTSNIIVIIDFPRQRIVYLGEAVVNRPFIGTVIGVLAEITDRFFFFFHSVNAVGA